MNNNRKGISNVVATIILIAVAIALAVAVAVWVFGLAGSASKTATLTVVQASLTGVSSGSPKLILVLNNPTGTSISLYGFTIGGLSCTFSKPVTVPGNATSYVLVVDGFTSNSSMPCTGSQTFVVGVQYSGSLTTTSGQTYPFTVTASS